MSYNNIIVKKGDDTMSIITVVNGSDSTSELINDHGYAIASLSDEAKYELLKKGLSEKVIHITPKVK